MKIAIMSDCHDRWENLEEAVATANNKNCEIILFAGDLISPTGLPLLERFNGQVNIVWGNNEGEIVKFTRLADSSKNIKLWGDLYEEEIDGIKIFMNHYPRITELAAKSGEFDLCIYGHDHNYKEEKISNTLFINTGGLQGDLGKGGSFVIFDTQTCEVERVLVNPK